MARARGRGRSSRQAGLSGLDFGAHLDELQPEQLKPCYLLLGDDEFLRSDGARLLSEKLLGPQAGPSLTELDGTKAGLGDVLDELRTLPFFGGARRVVVVKRADGQGKSGGILGDKANLERLASFLDAPPPTSNLVLVARKLGQRFKAAKELLKRVEVVDCSAPNEAGLLKFLRDRATAHGRTFARGVDTGLIERLGGEAIPLGQLDAEVRKLACAGEGPITQEQVEALAGVGSSEESFGLIDCVGRGDVPEALRKLHAIFRDGLVSNGDRTREPAGIAFMVLGLLRWDVGRLLRGRALLEAGAEEFEITKTLRVFRDKQRFVSRLRRADRVALGERHRLLREADMALKSSAADPQRALTDVIVRLAVNERDRRAG